MAFVYRRLLASLAGTAALTLASAQGYAQTITTETATNTSDEATTTAVEDSDGTALAPIVVTGGGTPGATGETVLTTVISRPILEERMFDNFDEIGDLTPNVDYNTTNGSFNVRGLDQGRVLTTIDGIRLPYLRDGARTSATGANYAGGLNLVDTNMLSSIDIMKGADSSVFGSGALGGVVELRTLQPEDLIAPGKSFGGVSKLGYDSADYSFQANQALATRINDTYALVQGSYRFGEETQNMGTTGGTGPTRTKPNPFDYDLGSFLGKINHHIEGGHTIGIAGEVFREDGNSKLFTSETASYDNYRQSETNERDRASISYKFNAPTTSSVVDYAEIIGYWQRQELKTVTNADRLINPAGPYERGSNLEGQNYGGVGNAVKTLDFQGIANQFTVGGELYGSTYEQFAYGKDKCTPDIPTCAFLHANQSDAPKVDGTTLGLFIEDKIFLADGRVRVIPGVRFDWYEYTPEATAAYKDNPTYDGLPDDNTDYAFSPKLRLEWDATPVVTLYAQWAQAFRAPDPVDLYMSYGGPGTYLRIGNPDLKPETSNGFEIGMKAGDRNLGATVALFDNYYKDFIDTETYADPLYPFGVTQAINRDRVRIYGAEATVFGRMENGLHGWAMIGFSNGKDTKDDIYLDSIPPLKGSVSIGYATDVWGTDLILTAAAARDKVPQDLTAAAKQKLKTDSYAKLDLTAWWAPEPLPGLTLRAGVFNLLDEKYVDALNVPESTTLSQAYFTEPGRTFRVTGTFQF
ncbi:hemoglobin/transferrin/lactoferrin receptor protein [Rhodoligotrophos appendicifer]|uniref:TonB-dependent hemoglobin/transferrin/lactoferrin family receptor n=1 Tax=Rhodoligotrophos appendicifer TaxID=987056 RepID=UPI001184F72B|nr:TonB-dependent hemoglobin/transferrin/lactoferrin family receptor [Rhodoligotrophos appendicifer]